MAGVKRFRFSLQRLLDLRQQEVAAARRELAAALGAVTAAENGLRAVENLLRRRLKETLQAEQRGVPAREFALQRRGLVRIQESREQARAGLEAARQLAEERRQQLMAALTRQRVLEKLRERRLEQWRTEVARAEQIELDELAAQARGPEEPVLSKPSVTTGREENP